MKFFARHVVPCFVVLIIVVGCLFVSLPTAQAVEVGQWYELYSDFDHDVWNSLDYGALGSALSSSVIVARINVADYLPLFFPLEVSTFGDFDETLGLFMLSGINYTMNFDITGIWTDQTGFYPEFSFGSLPLFSIYSMPKYIYFAVLGADEDVDTQAAISSFVTALESSYKPIDSNPYEDGGLADGGIYGSIYDLIGNAFYGSVDNISGYQELVITVLATLAVVIMFALPFLALWLFLKLIGVL